MDLYSKVHMLDDLDQLSTENLQAGRITRSAMAYAVRYAKKHDNGLFTCENLGGCMGGNAADRILADVLNDMFEAAKYKVEEAKKTARPHCVKCGQAFDDHVNNVCPPNNQCSTCIRSSIEDRKHCEGCPHLPEKEDSK
jgi:hypothetical protein